MRSLIAALAAQKRVGAIAAVSALAMTPSCREPTVMSVLIDTDLPCDTVRRAGVTITVGASSGDVEGESPDTVARSCDERTGLLHLVGDITLKRGKGDDLAFRVVLAGSQDAVSENDCSPPHYGGCVVARRKLRYLSRQSLLVPVSLRESCVDVPCAPDQTCVRGDCVSATIDDPAACAREGCDESVLLADGGAPAPPDADAGPTGPQDGGSDTGPFDAGDAAPVALTAGDEHACLLREGEVRCWGSNAARQLGGSSPSTYPAVIDLPQPALTIGAGDDHTCAILESGAVWCWGGGAERPEHVTAIAERAVAVAGGNRYTCAIVEADGTRAVRCWGAGEGYVLGNGFDASSETPVPVMRAGSELFLGDIRAIATGSRLACAVLDTTVHCWGDANWLLPGMSDVFATPVDGWSATSVAVGDRHMCFIVVDPTTRLRCVGDPDLGRLGEVPFGTIPPFDVNHTGSTYRSLSTRRDHTCGINTGSRVFCWGSNAFGQIGQPVGAYTQIPIVSPLGASAAAIATGAAFSCALLVDGSVKCWGDMDEGGDSFQRWDEPTSVFDIGGD